MNGLFGAGNRQIAAPFALAFVTLLLALIVLQRHQLGLPGSGGEDTGIGLGAVPIGRIAVAVDLVEAVDAVDPALQGRAQEFQVRVVDDQALHAALSFYYGRVQPVMAM